MRVAVLSPGYPPSIGGLESVVAAMCEDLARNGIGVEVWAHDTAARVCATDVRNDVTIRRFPTFGSGRFPFSPRLWAHVREHAETVDLIHAHGYHATAALSSLASRGHVPVVVNPHYHGTGHTPLAKLFHYPYRPLGARMLERASVVVAVSQAERELLAADFSSVAERIRTIHNGVDSVSLANAQPWVGELPTLLVIGRLEAYKSVDTVIETFQRVAQPSQLVVIGDGPDKSRLMSIASRTEHPERVRFLGRIPEPDLQRWLRTAHGVVSMSGHEAFGLVGLEAIAAGGRAVLSDIPAHRELLTLAPEGRIQLVSGSTAALEGALALCLEDSRAAPAAIRDWTMVGADYLAVYREALSLVN